MGLSLGVLLRHEGKGYGTSPPSFIWLSGFASGVASGLAWSTKIRVRVRVRVTVRAHRLGGSDEIGYDKLG